MRHTEWVGAKDSATALFAPGEFRDEHGTVNDGWVLAVGTDSTCAIEGTPEELRAFVADLSAELDGGIVGGQS